MKTVCNFIFYAICLVYCTDSGEDGYIIGVREREHQIE